MQNTRKNMKRILLASASIVAFAGAAAAEVTFSGSATLGYNDTDNVANSSGDDEIGFYWEADLAVSMTKALDNGLTAGVAFGFNVADDSANGKSNLGEATKSQDWVLSLTSDTAGLYFGKTDFAAQTHWVSAGDMESDGFSEADGETVLRGDVTYGGVNTSVSYLVDTSTDSFEQLSLGADATFGSVSVAFGYQAESDNAGFGDGGTVVDNGDYNPDEIFGISVGTSLAGADLRLAYASDQTSGENSIGVKASYPVGPVTLTAYYVSESEAAGDNYGVAVAYTSGPIGATLDFQNDQGTQKVAIDATYDVGNGITALAGYYMEDNLDDDFYVAAKVALGEGASLLVSYADGGADGQADDEIGGPAYQEGTTVEVGFSF
jgi:outer membrane protein OmpU